MPLPPTCTPSFGPSDVHGTECLICQENLAGKPTVTHNSCSRATCRSCWEMWILIRGPRSTCPLCRENLGVLTPARPQAEFEIQDEWIDAINAVRIADHRRRYTRSRSLPRTESMLSDLDLDDHRSRSRRSRSTRDEVREYTARQRPLAESRIALPRSLQNTIPGSSILHDTRGYLSRPAHIERDIVRSATRDALVQSLNSTIVTESYSRFMSRTEQRSTRPNDTTVATRRPHLFSRVTDATDYYNSSANATYASSADEYLSIRDLRALTKLNSVQSRLISHILNELLRVNGTSWVEARPDLHHEITTAVYERSFTDKLRRRAEIRTADDSESEDDRRRGANGRMSGGAARRHNERRRRRERMNDKLYREIEDIVERLSESQGTAAASYDSLLS